MRSPDPAWPLCCLRGDLPALGGLAKAAAMCSASPASAQGLWNSLSQDPAPTPSPGDTLGQPQAWTAWSIGALRH